MLVENGELCQCRIEKETGIMEKLINTELIQDEDGHLLSQRASVIKFLRMVPPQLDVEIRSKQLDHVVDNAEEDVSTPEQMETE